VDISAYRGEANETSVEGTMKRAAQRAEAAPSAAGRAAIDRSSKLYEACVEFEALFIKQMLTAMRKSVTKTGLLDGGMGQDIFEDMLYDEYSKTMAKTAGFGLADTVYQHLSALQQGALSAAPGG
jgi:Rod binding domain-containing protein